MEWLFPSVLESKDTNSFTGTIVWRNVSLTREITENKIAEEGDVGGERAQLARCLWARMNTQGLFREPWHSPAIMALEDGHGQLPGSLGLCRQLVQLNKSILSQGEILSQKNNVDSTLPSTTWGGLLIFTHMCTRTWWGDKLSVTVKSDEKLGLERTGGHALTDSHSRTYSVRKSTYSALSASSTTILDQRLQARLLSQSLESAT